MPNKYNQQLFINWLSDRMKEKGWGVRTTAKQAKVSHPIISDILSGKQPSEKTCILLAILFETSVEYVLQIGGHLQPRAVDGSPLSKTLAILINDLNEKQLEEAIRYIRFIKKTDSN